MCCKKKSFLVNRDQPTHVFRLTDLPKIAINQDSQWEFQLIISEIIGHQNQRWLRNFHFKFFVSIYLLKKLTMLWRFYINRTGCAGIIIFDLKQFLIISLRKNIQFRKVFETSFGNNIFAPFVPLLHPTFLPYMACDWLFRAIFK